MIWWNFAQPARWRRRTPAPLVSVIALCLMASACDPLQRYAGLANLGSLYGAAMDKLLVVAEDTTVDATSERLLQNREIAPQTIADYRKLSDLDVKRLETIENLRKHVKLLARYFGLLKDLATSDSPSQLSKSAAEASGNLNQLGQELRKSDLIPGTPVAAALTKIIVSGKIRGALKDELTLRGDTIRTELKTEKDLVTALSGDLKHAVAITKEIRESRQILTPYTASGPMRDDNQWIANRKALLKMNSTVDELAAAGSALDKLREAFESLMEGKLDAGRISALQEDFAAIVDFAGTVKAQL